MSEYAEVEALDEPVTDDESKHCSKKLKIGAKIGIPALVQASVEYIKNNIVETKKESATGNQSAASVEGKDSIAIAFGAKSKAKGALGCYIVLAEWTKNDEGERELKTVKCHKVDGKTIKPDT